MLAGILPIVQYSDVIFTRDHLVMCLPSRNAYRYGLFTSLRMRRDPACGKFFSLLECLGYRYVCIWFR